MRKEETPAQIKPHALGLLLILFLGALLRIYRLGSGSIWTDEGICLHVASQPFLRIPSFIMEINEHHPPLYFWFLHLWSRLGRDEFTLRLITVIFGVISIYALYLLGKLILGENLGLLAALLFALSPYHIWLSQEIKMYTLIILTSILSSFFLLVALDRNSPGSWLLYGFFSIMGLYSHNYMVSLLAAQGLFALLFRRERLFIWSLIGSALAALWLPWLCSIILQTGWDREYESLPFTPLDSIFRFILSPFLGPLDSYLLPVVLLLFLILLIASKEGLSRQGFAYLALYLLVPLFFPFLISKFTHVRLFQPRYSSIAFAPALLFLGAGILAIRTRILQILLVGIILSLNLAGIARYYFDPVYARPDYREAAHILNEKARMDDVVLLVQSMRLPALLYYYRGKARLIAREDVDSNLLSQLRADFRRIWLLYCPPDLSFGKKGQADFYQELHIFTTAGEIPEHFLVLGLLKEK